VDHLVEAEASIHRNGLGPCSGRGGSRLALEQRHLAEEIAGAQHRERRLGLGLGVDGDLARGDDVHHVARVALSEDPHARLVGEHELGRLGGGLSGHVRS
jgi:hypothetical protein